ncbi:hypothetical protein [Oricola indica]|uniref:hypothetical protein n=1 Tax=Oricola indica TaxID=2872591 RepID=UPI003CCBAF3E
MNFKISNLLIMLYLSLCTFMITPSISISDELISKYNAYINEADLYSSSGTRLTKAWQIIRQDRANFHRFDIRDEYDESDSFFNSLANRSAAERMLREGELNPMAVRMIVDGYVLIQVSIYGTNNVGNRLAVTVLGNPYSADRSSGSSIDLGNSFSPVMVGGSIEWDACSGNGEVSGLNPQGDNYLSVRAGPSSDSAETDRLGAATGVFLCDEVDGWFGIVYGSGGCGVTTPIEQRIEYEGYCRSGWVSKRYITITAG